MLNSVVCRFFVFTILSGFQLSECRMKAHNDSLSLYNFLFESGDHTPDIIPVCDTGDNVTVRIDVALRELVELNEKFQLIRVKIWVRLRWTDCSMTWSPGDYGGQDRIIVPYGKVWMPDLALYEGSSDEANMPDMKSYRASIFHNGTVTYNFPTIVTSTCRIDVTYFPYDNQNCSLTFSSWMYSGLFVDIHPESSSADTENFVPHNEWELISMESVRQVRHYNCCPDPYPKVTYYLVLARFPKFYLLTLFFPCIVVCLLSLLGFMLPPVSGEKISLQITILLTIVVFLLLVQDKLPSSSDTFPYIGIYFSISMILVCLSCVMSGIVMYVYYKGSTNEHVPPRVRKIFLEGLLPLLRVSLSSNFSSHGSDEDDNQVAMTDIRPLEETKIARTLDPVRENGTVGRGLRITVSSNDIPRYTEADTDSLHCQGKSLISNEWELLAYVLDRLFLIMYIVFTILNVSSFFILINKELRRF